MNPIVGGSTNPPNAPKPPTHPEAPPIASGRYVGTSLKTAALLRPMLIAISSSAATESRKLAENDIKTEPISIANRASRAVRSPSSRSAQKPPATLERHALTEKSAVRNPAIAGADLKYEIQ